MKNLSEPRLCPVCGGNIYWNKERGFYQCYNVHCIGPRAVK